eukprot:8528126-Alexandrium_andersonii.AAC.1
MGVASELALRSIPKEQWVPNLWGGSGKYWDIERGIEDAITYHRALRFMAREACTFEYAVASKFSWCAPRQQPLSTRLHDSSSQVAV